MTLHIPHSLDAVIMAVEALIEGRPMPEDWSRPEPVQPEPQAAPAPAAVFDEVLLLQAISDLVDQKLTALPKPEPAPSLLTPTDLWELEQRLNKIVGEKAIAPAIAPADLIVLEQKISEQVNAVLSPEVVGAIINIDARVQKLEDDVALLTNNFAILKTTVGVS